MVFDAATDRLVSRVTTSGTHYYTYDRAGNLVTDSVPGVVVAKFNYDALNRLVSVIRNGVLISRYGYDVLGRRIVKRVYSNSTGGTVGYLRMVYSGSAVSFETDSAGAMGLKYTWGPGTDNLLAIEDSLGNHYYATTDRLGSLRTLAKRDGTWLLTRRWDPYGNEISRDSSTSFTWGSRLRYGWTGREYDVEIGMYYHRARYYSQSLRRFIQEDPVEGSTSPYAYVHGSPLEATDPSGMMDSYEMRMIDPREGTFTGPRGPSAIIDGVPYDGNNDGWVSGIQSAGGGTGGVQLGTFGPGLMLTQNEKQLSAGAIKMIRGFESCKSKQYTDPGGNPTIGCGHLIRPGEKFDEPLTQAQMTELLASDVNRVVQPVLNRLTGSLTQRQIDGLGIFAFNAGFRSTVIRAVNAGDYDAAALEMLQFRTSNGRYFQGMYNRRQIESQMLLGRPYGSFVESSPGTTTMFVP